MTGIRLNALYSLGTNPVVSWASWIIPEGESSYAFSCEANDSTSQVTTILNGTLQVLSRPLGSLEVISFNKGGILNFI
jgi:hypothetical protein